jgi:excisionase family DNA binding protein
MPPKRKSETAVITMATHPLGTEIYTTDQVARALNLSVRTILRAIESGELEARKAGRQYLITQEAIRKYWDSLLPASKAKSPEG